MMKKKIKLKTKRLNLYPISDDDIKDLISECKDEELAQAYSEMLDGSRKNPEERQWYAPWIMETRDNNRRIGDLCFKGPVSNDSVEIGYGINKEYEGQGYTTEAAEALVNWAFENEGILFVEAEADENNEASIHIIEKLGFVKYGQGEEGPRFVKEKNNQAYLSVGISLGMCLGISLGMLLFDNLALGMCSGISIGTGFGVYMDSQEKKKIANLKKEHYGLE